MLPLTRGGGGGDKLHHMCKKKFEFNEDQNYFKI